MITIVGIGHVFRLEEQIKGLIREKRPEVVALELDRMRYEALRSGERGGYGNPVFMLFAKFQEKIAREYGTEAGHEMIAAADAAKEVGADIALIDRDAADKLGEFWARMSFKEKVLVFAGAIAAVLFVRRKTVEREIRKLQEQPDFVERIGADFPAMKEVLIDSRNEHMGGEVGKLAARYTSIVVVVGDGHVPGLVEILRSKSLPHETVRLKELRDGSARSAPPNGAPGGNANVSVSFSAK
jgi:pheromone shutdown protein TraB